MLIQDRARGAPPRAQVVGPAWYAGRRTQERAWLLFVHVVLVGGGIVILIPFIYMVSTSLKADKEIFSWPPTFFLPPVVWANYPKALGTFPFALDLRNTVLVTAANIIGSLVSCAPVAYGFARTNFKGRNALFILCLSTLMLPYQVTMIPLYIIFTRLHWVNTFLPLIVPAFFGNAFFIFLLRQFFATIPRELEDAARIDGCGEIRVFLQIIVPLAQPALAAVVIFSFLWNWNDFLGPLIYLSNDNLKTLQLGLLSFQQEYSVKFNLLMGVSTVIMLPCLVLFFLAQRIFIQGIVFSGIKG